MRRTVILCLMMGLNFMTLAQVEECHCADVFDELIEKLEANYIGLKHFQAKGRDSEYQERVKTFGVKAQSTRLVSCVELMQEFLSIFEDGHLNAMEFPQYSDQKKDSVKSLIKRDLNLESVQRLLGDERSMVATDEADNIIGVYDSGDTKIGIVKNGRVYEAYILETSREDVEPGELKALFEADKTGYKGIYYSYSYVPRFVQPGLYKDNTLLNIGSGVAWAKIDSGNQRELEMTDLEGDILKPTITKIDEDNVLFSVPSWSSVDYQQFVDLLKQNEEKLLNAKNLIFDIRGNRGGNAIYLAMFELFADKRMPGGQGYVLASEDNKAYFERNMAFSKQIYRPVVKAIEENMGSIVDGPRYPERSYKRDSRSKIENVAILTDEACMSASESFIIHAKQASSLVKTFGSPTAGVIDYTSVQSVSLNSCDQNILFGFPTSTLHKDIPEKGYNKTGIIPDVPIDKSVKDKVAFIMNYYKK